MVAVVAPAADDRLIEIGAGHGALTDALAPRVARVLALEIDAELVRRLAQRAPATVDTFQADALDVDFVAAARRVRQDAPADAAVRLVGNLPYNIAAPIVVRALRDAHAAGIRDAIFMLQREVAERVVALPGERSYGPLAIVTALHAEATRRLELPPGAFRPMPKVRSTLVAFRFRRPPRLPTHPVLFETMVRTLFTRRRKQVVNALADLARAHGHDATALCRAAAIRPTRRPGELDMSELIDLSEVLATRRK